jgi:hypothetical protein
MMAVRGDGGRPADEELGELSSDGFEQPPRSANETDDALVPQRQLQVGSKVVVEIVDGRDRRRIAETPAGHPDVEVHVTKATFRALPDIEVDVELYTSVGDPDFLSWFGEEPERREQWVQAVNANNSPARFHRLTRGLRQGSRAAGDIDDLSNVTRSMDLRQARIVDNPDWPRLRKVSIEELDSGLGVGGDTIFELLSAGAMSVGTREELWGDASPRRTDLCVTYQPDPELHSIVPLIAYGICRVAPLVTDEWRAGAGGEASSVITETERPAPVQSVGETSDEEAEEVASFTDVGPSQMQRISRMIRLCTQAEPLWSHEQRCYSETDLTVAPILAEELNILRDELARDCLLQIVGIDDRASELRLPQSPGPRLNGDRWRSSTWIDLMFAYERDGTEIDYDKTGRSPRGGHLFRVWITATGFGIGIRPGLNRDHQTRRHLTAGLPDGFPNLEPKAQGPESAHPHYLVGVRGRSNQYFARWSEGENVPDTDFFSTLEDSWRQVGPLLDEYRC